MFDLSKVENQINILEEKSTDPALWDNPEKAKDLLKRKSALEKKRDAFLSLLSDYEEIKTFFQLALEENDKELMFEGEKTLDLLEKKVKRAHLESLLSGEADDRECFLEVHAGAGGTEAQDWAQMIVRMYARWAEAHGYKVECLQESPGEEAGIKSVTLRICGEKAYGWLKTESGIHRLVRISPFDANAKRHTSFASVGVFPVVDDKIEINIDPSELRIDTYRASGAGGQHVNTTDSAVRITHLPSKIVVQCQNDRSQHRNKAEAMQMLKSRLYEKELQEREENANKENADKTEIGWGHQIRSYVLQPYQMVKDLRTQVETSNTGGVLDGDLDMFLEAALAQKVIKATEESACN